MKSISLIKHAKGAPCLRLFGLGPFLIPSNGIKSLQSLLNENTIWAKDRKKSDIKKMLANSNVIVTLWDKNQLIGFGRATTDKVYRAVLWDIVISKNVQRIGFGKILLEALINDKQIQSVEKIYLMTTNSQDFYKQLGFKVIKNQSLMLISRDTIS